LSRGVGHLLHLRQINVKTRPLITISPAGNDFSPLLRELADTPQVLGGQLPCCHVFVILEVREIGKGEFSSPMLTGSVCGAKWFLHSFLNFFAKIL
jgi:hypothetical protein